MTIYSRTKKRLRTSYGKGRARCMAGRKKKAGIKKQADRTDRLSYLYEDYCSRAAGEPLPGHLGTNRESRPLVLPSPLEDGGIESKPGIIRPHGDKQKRPAKETEIRSVPTRASTGRERMTELFPHDLPSEKKIKMLDPAPSWFSARRDASENRGLSRPSETSRAEADLIRQKKNLEKLIEERTDALKKVNRKLNEEIAKRRRHEDLMRIQRNLGFDLAAAAGLDEAFDLCLDAACLLDGVDGASLFFGDPESGLSNLASSRGFFDADAEKMFSFLTENGLNGSARHMVPVFFSREQLAAGFTDLTAMESLHTLACLPVRRKDEAAAGMLLLSKSYDSFPDSTREALMNMGALLEGVLARLWAESELKTAHDQLEKKVAQRTAELSEANVRLKREIMERARAEQALIRSEENTRALLNATTEQMMLINAEKKILAINDTGARLLGSTTAELIGQSAFIGLAPELAQWREAVINKAILFGSTIRFEDAHEDKIYQHNLYPIINQDGQNERLAIFSLDITERRRYEKQLLDYQKKLRLLATELAMAESRERRRLADDLHDRICQILYLCNMKAQEVRGWVADNQGQLVVDEMVGYLEQAIFDSRDLLMEISPPTLKILGLEAALDALGEEIQAKHGLAIVFVNDDRPKHLSDDMKDLVYRAARELVLNAVKHSRAQTVNMSVCREDSLINVTVEDDGVGFEVEQELDPGRNPDRFGLFSIRERLKALGGDLYVDSTPGWGTRACLTAPLVDENRDGNSDAKNH